MATSGRATSFMTTQDARDDSMQSILAAPVVPRDRRVALAFGIAIAIAFMGIASRPLTPLARNDGFIPAVQVVIVATDFIAAVLLFARYAVDRSRALLWLACGYLFSAVIVVAQTLTFPGAFTPSGLLGASPQTAAWLYVPWHLALPCAAIAYALAKGKSDDDAACGTSAFVIRRAVLATAMAAVAVIIAVLLARDILPVLVVSETSFSVAARVVTALPFAASAVAFVLVWTRRTSILDEWLMVALCAAVAEAALIVFVGASRYTLAFYVSRLFAVAVSSAVLVALLTDMARLYVRLSIAVKALQRERAVRLMNLDVVVGAIGHEIKQPLTVIEMCTTIIDGLLRRPTIPVDEVRLNLGDIKKGGVRIVETIDSLRGLFREQPQRQQAIDVNELARESLATLDAALSAQDIAITTELAPDLPRVIGHGGQLREVLINIVQNAIDAMAPLTDRPRKLQVGTSFDRGRVSITVQDSGPGIEPERLPGLFTASISTKTSGMGLGLNICQMIVDRHNGKLSVSSELGKRTRFEVILPADPAA